jgi:hypothetical protein
MATAQNFDDERQALARAKAQSILAEARAGRLEKIAAEQMNEAEAVKARRCSAHPSYRSRYLRGGIANCHH